MLCSHGSSQLSPSASTKVSSNHFLVIQSTPPISACRLCGIASRTNPQFSSNQLVSALLCPQMFLREMMKFPLHVERAHGLAVLEPDDPSLSSYREMSRVLCTASAKTRFRGKRPSSSNDKTHAVVPIFSALAYGLMFESPMSKCSRRYFR